jgi:hypothetical protein
MTSEIFNQQGYLYVPKFIDETTMSLLKHYLFLRIKAGHANYSATEKQDMQAPFSHSFYADPLSETILDKSAKAISSHIGEDVVPTYSYTRMYGRGDELIRHIDREACEISVSLHIARPKDSEISPLYFSKNRDGSDAASVLLESSDIVIYKGCDIWHWREKFEDHKWYLQMFLHYVRKEGCNKAHIYDKRPMLGIRM